MNKEGFILAGAAAEIFLCMWVLTFTVGFTKFGILPVKSILLLLFLLFSVICLIKINKVILRYKRSLLFLWLWVVVSIFVGIFNGFDFSTVSQAASVTSAFFVVIFSFVLQGNHQLNAGKLKKTIYLTALAGGGIKILMALGVVFGFFSAEGIDQMMQNYAGSTSFHVDMFGGFLGLFPRVGNSGDLFYLIVFLFYVRESGGVKLALLWLFALVFVLISYSRYLMIIFVIITLYAIALSVKNKPKITMSVICALISVPFLGFLDFSSIVSEIANRFTGQVQYEADSIRSEMGGVLSGIFYDNLIFGVGMGGYVRDYIRSDVNLWQYELEYLSMLMQFGIIGFLFIVVNFSMYVIRTLFSSYQKACLLPMIFGVVFWLGTPLQSSLFSGTQSALIVLSIFFLSRESAVKEGCGCASARK